MNLNHSDQEDRVRQTIDHLLLEYNILGNAIDESLCRLERLQRQILEDIEAEEREEATPPKTQYLVISGPSGVGKSTLIAHVLKKHPAAHFSRSVTTRAPRPGETDQDYIFVKCEEEYQEMKKRGLFLEDNGKYATLISELTTGADLTIIDVDHSGAKAIKKIYPHQTTVICLLPPSAAELRRRLLNRGANTEEEIRKRLKDGHALLTAFRKGTFCDFYIVNDNIEDTIARLDKILGTLTFRRGDRAMEEILTRLSGPTRFR